MEKKFYLSGGWGYGNKGDNAILEAMLGTFRSKFPDYSLVITSTSTREIRENHGLNAIDSVHKLLSKRNPLAILRWMAVWIWRLSGYKVMLSPALNSHLSEIKNSKAVVMGGGGYFNDAWPDMLRAKCLELEMARSANTPVIMYGQTIGPFKSETIERILKNSLAEAVVAYRDVQSREVLLAASVPEEHIRLTADEANLLDIRKGLVKKTAGRILVGVMVQNYRRHLGIHGPSPVGCITNAKVYVNTLVDSLVNLQLDVPTIDYIFIPSTSWDEAVCERVCREVQKNGGNASILSKILVSDFIAACQSVDFMISTNMHPVIIAATANKPSIALSYHYKLDDYMKSIGLERYVLRLDNFKRNQLVALAKDLISDEGVRDKIRVGHAAVKKLAIKNREMLEELITN